MVRQLSHLRLLELEQRTVPALVASFVTDIIPNSVTSQGNFFVLGQVQGRALLSANDGIHGWELWKSDGTAGGTVMVKDINPGSASYNTVGYNAERRVTILNNVAYFAANDGVHGTELWRTDGTEAGTYMVADINPGAGSSIPVGLEVDSVHNTANRLTQMTVINGILYFRASDGTRGAELWRSDGTALGTSMVIDINPGAADGVGSFGTHRGSELFFAANDGVHGTELWKSDGTAGGTQMVFDVVPGSGSSSPRPVEVNDWIVFGTSGGPGIWVTDGTVAGTQILLGGPSGTYISVVRPASGQELAFFYTDNSTKLWKTDGTPAGTSQPNPSIPWTQDGAQYGIFTFIPPTFGDSIYFGAADAINGYELWKSDGTAAGTIMLTDAPGNNPVGNSVGDIGFGLGRILFGYGGNAVVGRELWASDGTPASSALVADINTGSAESRPNNFHDVNGVVFFIVESDGVHNGRTLWRLDEATAPPHIANTRVNDGSLQRSRVTSLTVTFDTPVAFTGQVGNAFTLIRNGGEQVSFTASASVINGVTVVTLSDFTGASTQFGSLADGRYTLRALASQIYVGGVPLDGNGDGTPGDDYTFGDAQGLFRFFGDINGDRRVDISDYGLFSLSYLNGANYVAAFDFDGNGTIDIADYGQFGLRYLVPLP